MSEEKDEPLNLTQEFVMVLQWIGTSLEKLIDINMTQLSMQDEHTAKFVEYVHNQNLFMSDLTQEQLDALHTTFLESQEQNDETDRA